MSDTPRTDNSILVGSNTLNQGSYVRADFARELERELNAWKTDADMLSHWVDSAALDFHNQVKYRYR